MQLKKTFFSLILPFGIFYSNPLLATINTYEQLCEQAINDNEVYAHFRQHPLYPHGAEHPFFGRETADFLFNHRNAKLLKYLNEFEEVDAIGSPKRTYHPGLGLFSDEMLLNLLMANMIHQTFTFTSEPIIAEIGGGFGGLFYVLSRAFFSKDYYILDRKETCKLVDKISQNFLQKDQLRLCPFDQVPKKLPELDLVISTRLFSGSDRFEQIYFVEKIFKKAKRGLFLYYDKKPKKGFPLPEMLELLQEKEIDCMHLKTYEPICKRYKNVSILYWDKTQQRI